MHQLPPTPLMFTLDNNEITLLQQLGFSTDSGSTITSQRSASSAALPSSDLEERDDEDDERVQWDDRNPEEIGRAFMASLRIDGSTYCQYIGAGTESPEWSPTTPQITRPLNVRKRGTPSQNDSQITEADAEAPGHRESSADLNLSLDADSTQCAPSKEGRQHESYYHPSSQPSSSPRHSASSTLVLNTTSVTPVPTFSPLPSIPKSDPLCPELVEPSPIKVRRGVQVPALVVPAPAIPALALDPVPPPPSPAPSPSMATEPPTRPPRRRPTSYQPAPSPRSVIDNWPRGSPTTAQHPFVRPTSQLSAADAEHHPEAFTAPRPVPRVPKLAGPSPYTMRTASPVVDPRVFEERTRRPPTPPAASSPTDYKFTNRLNERRISVPIDPDEFPVTPRVEETRFPLSDRERDWNADTTSPITPAAVPAKAIKMLGIISPADKPIPEDPKKKKGKGFFGALGRSPARGGSSTHDRRRSSGPLLSPTLKTDKNGDVWVRMDSQSGAAFLARERAAGAPLESVPVPVEKDMVFTATGNLPRPPYVPSSPVTTMSMAPHFANEAELLAPPPSVRMPGSSGQPLRPTPTYPATYNSGATGSSPSTSYTNSTVYSTHRVGTPSTLQGSAYTSQSEYPRPENPRKDSASTISSSSSYSTVSSADTPSTPPLPVAPELPVYGAKTSLPAGGSVNRPNQPRPPAGSSFPAPPSVPDSVRTYESRLGPRTDGQGNQQQLQYPPSSNRRLQRESMHIDSNGKRRPKPIDTVAARENANRHLSVVKERPVAAHPPRPVVHLPSRVVPAPVEITFHHPARTRNRSTSTSTANTARVSGGGAASVRSGTGASTLGRKTSRPVHSPPQPEQPQTPQFIAYNYTSPVTMATQVGSIQALHPNQTAAALPDFLAIRPDTAGALTEGMASMSPQSAADKYGFNPVRNPDRPRNRHASGSGNTPPGAPGYGMGPLSYAQQQAAAFGGLGPVPPSPGPLLTGPGAPVSCFDPPTPVPSPKGWLGSMLTRA